MKLESSYIYIKMYILKYTKKSKQILNKEINFVYILGILDSSYSKINKPRRINEK